MRPRSSATIWVGAQSRHRLIEAALVDQLQLQALGKIAGEDAGGLESLQRRKHDLDHGLAASQALGNLANIETQIAALVDRIDENGGHGALRSRKAGHRQLGVQVIG